MISGAKFNQFSSDRQKLNIGLVLVSATLGLAGFLFPKNSRSLFTGSAIFYGLQIIESFSCDTWGYLCNV